MAIGEPNLTLEQVMEKAVCDVNNDKCMLRDCQTCPGKEGVIRFIQSLPTMEEKDELRYKKWVSVDRCTLQEVVESQEEYLESFSMAVVKLLRHHHISHKQSQSFKKAKEALDESTGILVGDFAENHSFLVQDAAQGFHWDNSQCTLHPFVFYFKGPNSTIQHKSFCFISDCTKHSTAMVHSFLKVLIPSLRESHPSLTEVIYFSDGCAGQYKNRFNFINLLYHEADFGIKAQWNFFATSHGKNACDGIGGTLKRSVSRASLQRPYTDQILTGLDFFNYCQEHIQSIKCYFISTQEVNTVSTTLEPRFSKALTICGTQKHHHFAPIGNGRLEIAEMTDSSSIRKQVKICHQEVDELPTSAQGIQQNLVGSYVVVKDNSKRWVAYVDQQDEEFGDYLIRFLSPAGVQTSYSFSEKEGRRFKDEGQIVGLLPLPSVSGGFRIRYSFPMQIISTLMILN